MFNGLNVVWADKFPHVEAMIFIVKAVRYPQHIALIPCIIQFLFDTLKDASIKDSTIERGNGRDA